MILTGIQRTQHVPFCSLETVNTKAGLFFSSIHPDKQLPLQLTVMIPVIVNSIIFLHPVTQPHLWMMEKLWGIEIT